jgi:hypothetical protein
MEAILYIIWFVGLLGSIILTMIAVMWAAEKRNDAHFKAMTSHSLVDFYRHEQEWKKWARITMSLLYSATALSIISLIAIISAKFV